MDAVEKARFSVVEELVAYPPGMTAELLEEAVLIIEKWEECGADSVGDLALELFSLFMRGKQRE